MRTQIMGKLLAWIFGLVLTIWTSHFTYSLVVPPQPAIQITQDQITACLNVRDFISGLRWYGDMAASETISALPDADIQKLQNELAKKYREFLFVLDGKPYEPAKKKPCPQMVYRKSTIPQTVIHTRLANDDKTLDKIKEGFPFCYHPKFDAVPYADKARLREEIVSIYHDFFCEHGI